MENRYSAANVLAAALFCAMSDVGNPTDTILMPLCSDGDLPVLGAVTGCLVGAVKKGINKE